MGRLLSVAEASHELAIHNATIYRWINTGIDGHRLEKHVDDVGKILVEENALFEMANRWEQKKELSLPTRVLITHNGHTVGPVENDTLTIDIGSQPQARPQVPAPPQDVPNLPDLLMVQPVTATTLQPPEPYTYQNVYGWQGTLRVARVTLCYRHIKGGTAVGIAICSLNDTPDEQQGKRIAKGRADIAAQWHLERKMLSLRDGRRYRTRGYKRVKMWGRCDARSGFEIQRYDAQKALESVSENCRRVFRTLGKAFVISTIGWRIDETLLAKEQRHG